MDEHETDPQRHEGSSLVERAQQPAVASQPSGIPAGGQSPYGEQPTAQQPAWTPPAAPPASPWQQPQQPHPQQPSPYGYQQQPYAGYNVYQAPTQTQPQYAYAGGGAAMPGQPPEYPAWAQPVAEPQPDPARSARGRRILVTGAVAVLIALGPGGV